MRLSKLAGKEIINLQDGGKLGVIGESDLIVSPETGALESIVIPGRSSFFHRKEDRSLVIPWRTIKKIGAEVIIVDLSADRGGNTVHASSTGDVGLRNNLYASEAFDSGSNLDSISNLDFNDEYNVRNNPGFYDEDSGRSNHDFYGETARENVLDLK